MADKGLVTGFRGTPHIDADDIASLTTGVVGPGDYVLNTRDGLRGTMSSANTFVLASGDLLMQGRHVTFPTPTSATVESGAQGMKRNDLAVCRYTKATNGVENAELKILKGTSTQNSPADPAYENGRIIEGSTIADMPLYRIPVTGITVGEPVPLYDKLPSMWDSVSHTDWLQVTPGDSWQWAQTDDPHLSVSKSGKVVELRGAIGKAGGWRGGWTVATIPEGYRPSSRVWFASFRRNVSFLFLDPDGTLYVLDDHLTGAAFADLFIHATWLM